MADAHTPKNHSYHLVDPSPWPIVGAVSAFVLALGGYRLHARRLAAVDAARASSASSTRCSSGGGT